MQKRYRFLFFLLSMTVAPAVYGQFYYGLHQTFGKNRVQYQNFTWSFYRYERFDVFHYQNGQHLAQQVARMVSREMPLIEQMLDVPLDERIQVVVFNTLGELTQSNLNASTEEAYNTGGVTHFSGTRMFVYFNGDYAHLEAQVREGLAGLAMNNLMYGGFTRSLRNSTLLNLPDWYTQGLLAYISQPYDNEVESRVLDAMVHDEFDHIYGMTGVQARAAGHSLWNYIAQTYGRNVIKEIVYTTVRERSIDRGLEYNLGVDSDRLLENWKRSFLNRLNESHSDETLEEVEIYRSREEGRISRPTFSSNGQYMAFVSNYFGKYKVHLVDVATGERQTILRGGHLIAQNVDYSYPLLTWHPNGRILAMLTEEEGIIRLNYYDLETGEVEQRNLYSIQKVTSFTYSQDGRSFLISGIRDNKSNIYIYSLSGRGVTPITNDGYSDMDPIFINNDRFIVFRSNRDNDTLRVNQEVYNHSEDYNLFVYRVGDGPEQVLWRLNPDVDVNEINLEKIDDTHFAYLDFQTGEKPKQYIVTLDSSIAYVDTITHYNYFTREALIETPYYGTIDYDIQSAIGAEARVYIRDGRFRMMLSRDFVMPSQFSSNRSEIVASQEANVESELTDIEQLRRASEVNIENYSFDSRILSDVQPRRRTVVQRTEVDNLDSLYGEDFPIHTDRNYILSFLRDEFTVQVDNVFDYPQYQPFTGTPNASLINTGFNTMFKVGAIDILEDYRMVAGFRTDFQPLPGVSLSPNSEFLLAFLDKKSRWNHEVTFYRRSQVAFLPQYFLNARYLTYEAHSKWSYPLSQVSGFHFSGGYRNQRQIILLDNAGAVTPPETDPVTITDYGILKATYVYDDTRKKGINLYHGLRYKVFTEFYENFSASNSGLFTAGIDLRHYLPVHREIIWANRFAYGTSFGNEKLLYFLGGVDNEFSPQFANQTPFATNENYVFQSVVTNMRGFFQNIRNGNNFAVINSELRIPLVKYLYNRPIQNDFLANFQVIGFGDIGTAWNGLHPYDDENAINTRVVDALGYQVVLDTQREPIVGGFGVGLRSRILGYFCRVDWAWGVEDGALLDNVFYFSLSTDF